MLRIQFAGAALAASLSVGAIFGSSSAFAATVTPVAPQPAAAIQSGSLGSQAPQTINLGASHAIPGTNCSVTVGGWNNYPYHYPGVASQVWCGSRHTIQVENQILWAGTSGVPYLFYQSGWYTYPNAFGTREIDNARAWCPSGSWHWWTGIQVYVDGVYRGGYPVLFTDLHWWTACS